MALSVARCYKFSSQVSLDLRVKPRKCQLILPTGDIDEDVLSFSAAASVSTRTQALPELLYQAVSNSWAQLLYWIGFYV